MVTVVATGVGAAGSPSIAAAAVITTSPNPAAAKPGTNPSARPTASSGTPKASTTGLLQPPLTTTATRAMTASAVTTNRNGSVREARDGCSRHTRKKVNRPRAIVSPRVGPPSLTAITPTPTTMAPRRIAMSTRRSPGVSVRPMTGVGHAGDCGGVLTEGARRSPSTRCPRRVRSPRGGRWW